MYLRHYDVGEEPETKCHQPEVVDEEDDEDEFGDRAEHATDGRHLECRRPMKNSAVRQRSQ